MSKCVILVPKNVWTHDQIYVALSRCGNPNNIYIWGEQEQFKHLDLPEAKKYIKNVVYENIYIYKSDKYKVLKYLHYYYNDNYDDTLYIWVLSFF